MEKAVVIGVGFIGEYMTKGLEGLMGGPLAGRVFGIKGSSQGLEQRQAQLGFDVSVGDIAQVLERENPSIILLCPPPEAVPAIATDILAPYYNARREKRQPLPDLYSFAPSPSAKWLCRQLGEGARCAKILPNIFCEAGGYDITPLGMNYVTTGRGLPWPAPRLAVLRKVLAPYGETVLLSDDDSLVMLSGKITSHVCCEVCYTIADAAAAAGVSVSIQDLGRALRAAQRARWPRLPEICPCDDQGLPALLRPFVRQLANAWFDGMAAFTASVPLAITDEEAQHIDCLSFALNVFPIAVENRAQLEQDTKNAATKGGVLERGIAYFYEEIDRPLADAVTYTLATGESDPAFFTWLAGQSEALSRKAYQRSLHLTEKKQ